MNIYFDKYHSRNRISSLYTSISLIRSKDDLSLKKEFLFYFFTCLISVIFFYNLSIKNTYIQLVKKNKEDMIIMVLHEDIIVKPKEFKNKKKIKKNRRDVLEQKDKEVSLSRKKRVIIPEKKNYLIKKQKEIKEVKKLIVSKKNKSLKNLSKITKLNNKLLKKRERFNPVTINSKKDTSKKSNIQGLGYSSKKYKEIKIQNIKNNKKINKETSFNILTISRNTNLYSYEKNDRIIKKTDKTRSVLKPETISKNMVLNRVDINEKLFFSQDIEGDNKRIDNIREDIYEKILIMPDKDKNYCCSVEGYICKISVIDNLNQKIKITFQPGGKIPFNVLSKLERKIPMGLSLCKN